ncbi:MAG: PP2C family protein-serine/threonine phosphatase [Planctomycetota bacterium]
MEADVNWDECLQHAAVSDIGMRRASNQDSHAEVLASDVETWRRSGHLFVVADGMGAHAAGELASEMAVSGITHRYYKYHHLSPPDALRKAIQDTNTDVYQRGQANVGFHNMGTTASTLVLLPQGALVAHVGDSRVYRQRGNQLEQLTFDHSLAWEIQASGQFRGNAEFANAVPKNIITRSLGPNETVRIDFEGPFPLVPDDTFLLCSDGLTGLVEDEEIGPLLASLPPGTAAQALADLANLRGGHDNITVVVVRVTGPSPASHHGGHSDSPTTEHAEPPDRITLLAWIAASVSTLAALAMLVLKRGGPAVVAIIVGVVAVLLAIIRRWARTPDDAQATESRRFGKGPYVTVQSPVNTTFTGKLAELVNQLRSVIEEEQWGVDIQEFDAQCRAAEQAVKQNKHETALRHYVNAVSAIMHELRMHNDKDSPR